MLCLQVLAAQHVLRDFDGRHIVHIELTVLPLWHSGHRPVGLDVEGANWPETVLLVHFRVLLLHDHRREVVEGLV